MESKKKVNKLWNTFKASGRIEDYLNYSFCKKELKHYEEKNNRKYWDNN